MVTWNWTADTLFWQVPIEFNMGAQYQIYAKGKALGTRLLQSDI